MTIRTQLKAGRINLRKHNVLAVRSELKAGRMERSNHNEAMQTRTGLKAGARKNVRASLLTTGRKDDRLSLMVVRVGLRAGRRAGNHNETLAVRTALKAGRMKLSR